MRSRKGISEVRYLQVQLSNQPYSSLFLGCPRCQNLLLFRNYLSKLWIICFLLLPKLVAVHFLVTILYFDITWFGHGKERKQWKCKCLRGGVGVRWAFHEVKLPIISLTFWHTWWSAHSVTIPSVKSVF